MILKTFTQIKTGIMKKILTVLAISAVVASCSSNPKTGTEVSKDVVTTDTAGLYKDQNRVMNVNGANDTTITTVTTTTVSKAGTAPLIAAPVATAPRSTARRTTAISSSRNKSYSSGGGTSSQPSQPVARRRGWSKAAKGTVIGAGSGAVIGAVISKKKGKGAIIGGVLGAGVGYGIGRSKDKKDGRY